MAKDDDQEELAFRGCLGFVVFAWVAPILFLLFLGWGIYGRAFDQP